MSERDDYDPRIDTVKNPGQFSAPWIQPRDNYAAIEGATSSQQATTKSASSYSDMVDAVRESCSRPPLFSVMDRLIEREVTLQSELVDVINLQRAIPEWVGELPADSVTEEELVEFLS